jgi:hypothetical protein
MTDKSTLFALADRIDDEVINAAREGLPASQLLNPAEAQRIMMAYAASCATVAAALRAMAGGVE